MNIVHIGSSYFPHFGGGALRLERLIKPLLAKHQDVKVSIITHNSKIAQGKVVKKSSGSLNIFYLDGNIFTKLPTYRKILKNESVDLIHTHNFRASLIAHLVSPSYPQIIELHSLWEMNSLKKWMAKRLIKRCQGIIVLADCAKSYLSPVFDLKPGNTTIPIKTIVNGIDPVQYPHPPRKYRAKSQYNIGYVGTFENWEGIPLLLECFKDLVKLRKNIKLYLIGEGTVYPQVKEYIKDYRLERWVVTPGIIKPQEIRRYYDLIDIFVLPRFSTLPTETAIPLKILEAMASALPIAATKVGGLTEVLTDKKNALLVEPGDKKGLFLAIQQLLDNPRQMEYLSSNVLKKVRQWPTWEDSANKLYQFYKLVISH